MTPSLVAAKSGPSFPSSSGAGGTNAQEAATTSSPASGAKEIAWATMEVLPPSPSSEGKNEKREANGSGIPDHKKRPCV
jgi:hypothetical protein